MGICGFAQERKRNASSARADHWRGRTTVEGAINGKGFQATLEPDGQLNHWLRVEQEVLGAAGVAIGDLATLEIMPVEHEPEPFGFSMAAHIYPSVYSLIFTT